MMNRILSAALAGAFLVAAPAAADPGEVWSDANKTVSKLVETRARTDFATPEPESPQLRHLQKLMADAIEILSTSDVLDERERILEIQEEIRALQSDIADWRFAMTSAPDGDSGLVSDLMSRLPLQSVQTKASFEVKIARAEAQIADLRQESKDIRADFIEGLHKIGIDLTADQVDGLMSMATAEGIIDMQTAFDNMKAINGVLLEATVQTDESLDVAKRYYGIYTVMLEVAMFMHEDFIDKVNNDYLVKLDRIIEKTQELRKEANSMLQKEKDKGLRKTLQNNVAAQDLTLRTADLYKKRLIEQRDRVRRSLRNIERQHGVAVNTYRTVEYSSDLVTMMRNTGKAFDALMKLEIPPIRPFESLEMQNEFERLTNEIATS